MSVALAVFLVGLIAFPAWGGVLRLDMGDEGLEAGWHAEVHGGNRFDKAPGNANEPVPIALDINDDGSDETIRAGYNGWSQDEQPSSARSVDGTWPAGYGVDLQKDFSGPKSTSAKLIVWNLPAGNYAVTMYMRDYDWGGGTYVTEAHDGTLFSVAHDDWVDGDLLSISDVWELSTIDYDPDTGGNYDAQPSLWFTSTSTANSLIMGIEIEPVVEEVGPVPEPGLLGLLGLGGLALLRRRRA
jgi:MYXO-CTERM domain-containing protein